MSTAATILNRAEGTLDWDRTSVGVPGLESTHLLAVLNDAIQEYHSSFEKNGEPSSILKKETGYTIVADTALAANTAAGATSYTVDSSASLGSSGALVVWDNDVPDYNEFTSNNLSTTLSGVTGLNYAHETDDAVSLLYALPSNFISMRSQEGNEDGVLVNGVPYSFTSGIPTVRNYAIYDNGTTKYLHFPRGSSGDVYVSYNAAPTTIDEETDTVDIPTVDEWFPVWRIVEYASLKLGRPEMYQLAQQNALKILSSAHRRRNIGKRPKGRPTNPRGYAPPRSYIFDN